MLLLRLFVSFARWRWKIMSSTRSLLTRFWELNKVSDDKTANDAGGSAHRMPLVFSVYKGIACLRLWREIEQSEERKKSWLG